MIPVSFEVLGVELVRGGRVQALANVSIEIAGVGFTVQGCRVIRTRSGGLTVEGPAFKHPDGHTWPAVVLPSELRDAIGAEVLCEVAALPSHARRA